MRFLFIFIYFYLFLFIESFSFKLPIRSQEDREVIERFRHIPCKAGDLVIWDYRIPHANALKNVSSVAREVIYIGAGMIFFFLSIPISDFPF